MAKVKNFNVINKNRYWVYWGYPIFKFSGRSFSTLKEAVNWSKKAVDSFENKAEEIIIFKGVKVVKSDVKPLFP